MKTKCAVWTMGIILLIFNHNRAFGQKTKDGMIDPVRISVTHNKTTNLIFQYAIKSVDRGSRDILVQKVAEVENVLQVKSVKPGFEETNLTVVTADGSLFSFLIRYEALPAELNRRIANELSAVKPMAIFTADATNDVIAANAATIISKKTTISKLKVSTNDITMQIRGIYIDGDVLYFQLGLGNASSISYDVQQLRLFIVESKRPKRTASQEVDITPIHISGNGSRIGAFSEQVLVFAASKFTIPEKKKMVIQLMEKNGGRHLMLKVTNKQIMLATMVH